MNLRFLSFLQFHEVLFCVQTKALTLCDSSCSSCSLLGCCLSIRRQKISHLGYGLNHLCVDIHILVISRHEFIPSSSHQHCFESTIDHTSNIINSQTRFCHSCSQNHLTKPTRSCLEHFLLFTNRKVPVSIHHSTLSHIQSYYPDLTIP